MTMQERRLDLGPDAGGIRLGYVEWGSAAANRTVVCVHGLTRNARDFDALAERLSQDARVISIDVVGRGRSDWLADPSLYVVPTYVAHFHLILQRLGLTEVDWVGTSMGGLIGMGMAAGEGSPIRRLILNDIGAFVPKEALGQIASYLGLSLVFATLDELEAHLRVIHAPFGPLTDAQWRHLAVHSSRQDADGFRLSYDPAIRTPFVGGQAEDIDLWALYDTIACPTLLIRGGESKLLLEGTATEMTGRGPKAELVTFPGCGHAPALMAPDQIEAVAGWLGL